MLLSTMTYEQIYREIKNDFRDVRDNYKRAVETRVSKLACKSPFYPFRRFESYTHPISKNNYTYFCIVNKHSQWKTPDVVVYCEYEGKFGKEIITIAVGKDHLTGRKILYTSIFQAHFFKRYYERFIKDERGEYDKIAIFLARNAGALPLGKEAVSANEKEDPGYTNVALLNLDGLCLGKRSIENHGIIIYKTFVPLNELYSVQYEKVLPQYMQMVFTRACLDNPQCGKTLEKIAADGVAKCNELIQGGNSLNDAEKLKEYFQRYQDMCQALGKYIII